MQSILANFVWYYLYDMFDKQLLTVIQKKIKRAFDFLFLKFLLVVEEPGFKNVKNKHLGMSPF